MGGRGAASGTSAKGIKYGEEYRTLLAVDNIKFIRRNEGAANAPLETMSGKDNRIYVVLNARDRIKSITFYDEEGMRAREIHIHHQHGGFQPHTHVGYDSATGRDDARDLTPAERKMLNKILQIWKEFKNA